MKNYLYRLVMAFIVVLMGARYGTAFADSDLRKDQVPNAVIQRFKQDYPKARSIEYELETDNERRVYAIEFKVGRRKAKAYYQEDGTVVSTGQGRLDNDD
jgi:hypothetical protein